MAYRIEHLPQCGCQDRTPALRPTPAAVRLYLWGREIPRHLVYEGECPYRFFVTDVDRIAALLDQCALARIKRYLPCAMVDGAVLLVAIGTSACGAYAAMEYERWLAPSPEEPPDA